MAVIVHESEDTVDSLANNWEAAVLGGGNKVVFVQFGLPSVGFPRRTCLPTLLVF